MSTPQIVCYIIAGISLCLGLESINNDDSKAFSKITLLISVASLLIGIYNPFSRGPEGGENSSPTDKTITCNHSINSGDSEYYGNNLNPNEYYLYASDYQDFYFSYPPHLFYATACNFNPYSTTLGENIETHTFFGDHGTVVTYSLSSRKDGSTLEKAVSVLFTQESAEITYKKKTLRSINDNFPGFAVTGYDNNGMIIYRLARVYSNYVMELRIVCPPYENKVDEQEKRYVQECIVKFCGFSSNDRKDIRSFDEFKNSP